MNQTMSNEGQVVQTESADVITLIRDGRRIQPIPSPGESERHLEEGLTVCVCAFKRPDSLVRFLDSLPDQDLTPDRLVIVDASPDDRVELSVEKYPNLRDLAKEVLYFRVGGIYQTLTCSRNYALRWVSTDLMVFFDDDIVLQPGCLTEMVSVHRQHGDQVVGVGAHDQQGMKNPPTLWKLRRLFRIVSSLKPGSYNRSGISIPWIFQESTEATIEGDWLTGCAMMWKTTVVRKVKFNESFGGHSTGEDLDVSLRMGQHGKLMMAGRAHVLHLPDRAGRPNSYMIAYAGITNAYDIHCRCLPNRSFLDGVRFMYAFGMDTFLRSVTLLRPGQVSRRWDFVRGRTKFFVERLFHLPTNLRRNKSSQS